MFPSSILEEPTVRHYIPPNKPQVRVNFYKLSKAGVSIQPRSIEMAGERREQAAMRVEAKNLLAKPIEQLVEEARAKLEERGKGESEEEMTDVNESSSELWVDKYVPRHFTDLITDERVSRELLIWMKTWDKIVFPKKRPPQKVFLNNFAPSQPVFLPVTLQTKSYFQIREKELSFEAHKVALIAGPPGTGKTSLARVIAHHCGYETIEVRTVRT